MTSGSSWAILILRLVIKFKCFWTIIQEKRRD